MRFANPAAFLLLLLVPGVLLGLHVLETLRARRIARAGDPGLIAGMVGSPDGRSVRLIQAILLAVAVGLAVVALARPQFGSRTELRKTRGMDLVIALDLSRSMLARDVVPSRLDRAKIEIGDLMRALRGDRVGLVGFTSGALPLSPLTVDHAAVALQLQAAQPRDMPRGGTSIGRAIETARALLARARRRAADQAIVVVTDGEEHEGEPETAARKAAEAGIEVHIVGVGSRTGEPIPQVDENGRMTGYLKDADGRTVVSRLNETMLTALAKAGGGLIALPGPSGGLDLSEVRAHLLTRKRAELEDRVVRIYRERFQWPLGAAFGLLLLATVLRPSRRVRPSPGGPAKAAGLLIAIVSSPAFAQPLSTEDPDARAGRSALAEGRGDDAQAAFEAARARLGDRPELLYDLGLAAAARGELGEAEPLLRRAMDSSKDRTLAAESAFALGNTYRKLRKFDEAIEAYQRALVEDPRVAGARRNLELTRRMKAIRAAQPPSEDGDPDREPPPDERDGGRDDGGTDGGPPAPADAGPSPAEADGGTQENPAGSEDPGDGGNDPPDAGSTGAHQPDQGADAGVSPPPALPPDESAPGDAQEAEQLLEALQEQERALQRTRALKRFGDRKVTKDW